MIKIEHLIKKYHANAVLQDISLTITPGHMVGLVGPDGAGKTTLLRLISALLLPTQGRIEVFGLDTVKDAEEIHGFCGYMPQRFGLYEDLSVEQNLKLYASLRGLPDEEKEATFEKLYDFTTLKPFKKRVAGALSGGMKQKLGLACALMSKPKLLILDEPSVGVDPISRRELWKMVRSLLDNDVTVIWSTAYLDEAEQCEEIIFLDEGKVLYQGAPKDLTKRCENRVFLMSDKSAKRRAHLHEIEKRPHVVDALIQGTDIRIVTKEGELEKGEPCPPRLEDAFVDILGGIRKGEPPISKNAPKSTDGHASVIEAKGLVKQFGDFTAVNDVSFSVKRGEIFGLLGPNGAGKSTTFKMLCGLLKPTEGTARINGFDLQENPQSARSQLGYMAQKFSLYGNLSVRQNLEFFASVYPVMGTLEEKLHIFSLELYKDWTTDDLPLGFKQRLALAAALLHWPDVLFLDEPTSGMDPIARRDFWSEMNGLVQKGKTVLVSTHFMDEAENCDRIALIYKGQMIHLGEPDELKEIAKDEAHPNPTLEDAFIKLIQEFDAEES